MATEKLTRIMLPGTPGAGCADWGEKTVPEMIKQLRDYAAAEKRWAEAVLKAPDSAFAVDIVRGSVVQHHVRTLQTPGKEK